MNFDFVVPALNVAGFCERIRDIAEIEDQRSIIRHVQKMWFPPTNLKIDYVISEENLPERIFGRRSTFPHNTQSISESAGGTTTEVVNDSVDGAVRRCQTLNFLSLLKNDPSSEVESRWYHNCSGDTRSEPSQNK